MLHDDPNKWDEFVSAYARELREEPVRGAEESMRDELRKRNVTLLFGARCETQTMPLRSSTGWNTSAEM